MRHVALVTLLLATAVACSRQNEASPTADAPTLDVTSWTDKTELFMEHPPLVAGQTVAIRRASDAARATSAR